MFGPIIFGILDSSFLVLPFGNDLLVVLLAAQRREWFAIYATAAALGALAGTFVLDLVSRKGGEEGLKKLIHPKKFEALKNRLGN